MNTKSAFQALQLAKAQLILAQKKQDSTEVENWQQCVTYWQRVYEERKHQLA